MKDYTTIILEGGLGNRMRVAAAALATARRTGLPFRVLWLSQWGMPCRFDSLFLPPIVNYRPSPNPSPVREGRPVVCKSNPPLPNRGGVGGGAFILRDAQGWERAVYARARAANLWMPRAIQHLMHRRIITSPQVYYLQRDGFDFDAWFRQGGELLMAYRDFAPYTPDDLRQLFRPQPAVQQLVDELCERFTPHTIGCHIRRTDNQQSIDESPLELFIAAIDSELDKHADTRIFLATDDEPTKSQLYNRYGQERLITTSVAATRNTSEGICHALAEMLALAATSHVYGSAGSTFSQIATMLGGIPLIVLKR